jgi:argininosuccinate synthase
MVVGRKSPNPLYHPDYATFEEDTVYDQKLADGFIQLNALRLKIRKLSKSKK